MCKKKVEFLRSSRRCESLALEHRVFLTSRSRPRHQSAAISLDNTTTFNSFLFHVSACFMYSLIDP